MPKGKKPPAPKEEPKPSVKNMPKPAPEPVAISETTKDNGPKKGHKFKRVMVPKKAVGEGEWETVEKREAYLVERPVHTDSDDDGASSLSD